MNRFAVFLTSLMFSLHSASEINNRAFLNEIFLGCNSGSGPDYELLVNMVGTGGVFEYCGCAVNKLSKSMQTKDLLKLGLDSLAASGGNVNNLSDEALAKLLQNENFSNAISVCLAKVVDN